MTGGREGRGRERVRISEKQEKTGKKQEKMKKIRRFVMREAPVEKRGRG